jgi:NAD(P)-dependent dehydrogenase (short-subunit alcohol dehydrogenase family)
VYLFHILQKVLSCDLVANEEADLNVLVKLSESWQEQSRKVNEDVTASLDGLKLAACICVAGGWAGGNAASDDVIANADMMWKQSVWTSMISATISARNLEPGGLVVLTGATPALGGTPAMIGYGMAKAAVHQLVLSLASKDSGLPAGSSTLAILPMTLDTPMNRKFMPAADTSTWTPLEVVGEYLLKWTTNVERPTTGSLVQLETRAGKTTIKLSDE